MTSSLVGSEMCIRDRFLALDIDFVKWRCKAWLLPLQQMGHTVLCSPKPVSYTHLTLPTICSV
eukprot:6385192-Prorocentrum_lima.AAC.1